MRQPFLGPLQNTDSKHKKHMTLSLEICSHVTITIEVNTTSQTTTAYEWYNISQIYTDAAMIQTGDTRYISYTNSTYDWMNNI